MQRVEWKKKKEVQKIRTDFLRGVFLSNIYGAASAVCVQRNAFVTKSMFHTWLNRTCGIERRIRVFHFTTKFLT